MRTANLAFAIVWLALPVAVLAQETVLAQERGDNGFELRTYDVGGLTLEINDHTYSKPESVKQVFMGGGGGFGGGGEGGIGMPASQSDKLTVDSLRNVIVNTLATETWQENSGRARIAYVGTAIVVWQSPQVHQQIAALLNSLRSTIAQRRTLRIDARWLLLNSDDLDKLVSTEDGSIDRKELDRLTRQPTTIRAITNCFSGQKVYLVSGTRRSIIQSYIPVVGSLDSPGFDQPKIAHREGVSISLVSDQSGFTTESRIGYQPVTTNANFGALLEIQPHAIQDSDDVVVDLTSTITVPSEQPAPVLTELEASGVTPAIDRVAIETQVFATTLLMPTGKPFLSGGMTYAPAVDKMPQAGDELAQANRGTEQRQLYLVLEIR